MLLLESVRASRKGVHWAWGAAPVLPLIRKDLTMAVKYVTDPFVSNLSPRGTRRIQPDSSVLGDQVSGARGAWGTGGLGGISTWKWPGLLA